MGKRRLKATLIALENPQKLVDSQSVAIKETKTMTNENHKLEETREFARIIVFSARNQIQMVLLIEVQVELPINSQYNCYFGEVSGQQTSTLMMLLFFVLLAQMLMFWRVKKRG